ncbi:MAG: DUF2066 domain-containing protein [Acetobacteraceae bacterium]
MRSRSGLLLTMVLMFVAASAQGAIVNGLYEASVPVPDQTPAARAVALQQALAAVLVKVTGERTAGPGKGRVEPDQTFPRRNAVGR